MDERMLLLLGLLKAQGQHGYQINEFIENNLKRVINMKRSTAYSLLDRLCEQGYADSSAQQAGNRPQKKVYTLTAAGEEAFLEVLRSILSQAEQVTVPFEIGLMFLDHLTPTEVNSALQQRLEHLTERVAELEEVPAHRGRGVDLAIAHRKALVKAERAWLVEALEQREHEAV